MRCRCTAQCPVRIRAADTGDQSPRAIKPGAARRRCRARRTTGVRLGPSVRGVGAVPATDAGAARGVFATARSAHRTGHRSAQRRRAQALCRTPSASRSPACRQDAGLSARLRRRLAASVSRPAACEPARCESTRHQHRRGTAGGVCQRRLCALRAARAAVAGRRRHVRPLHGRQPPGRARIRQWAVQTGVDPAKVRDRAITLNHDAGHWLSLGLPGQLPAVLREVHGQWQRQ